MTITREYVDRAGRTVRATITADEKRLELFYQALANKARSRPNKRASAGGGAIVVTVEE